MGEAKGRLSREAWSEAALGVIAREGIDAVAVEPLARGLGATKGSFYWHFADRADLVAAAVAHWEARATGDVIAELDAVNDPRERLRRVLKAAFEDPRIAVDAALAARGGDPVIGPVVRRVTRRRLAFLAAAYEGCGLPPAEARRRARVAYSAYLGHAALARADEGVPPVVGGRSAYMQAIVATLVPPAS